MSTIHTVVAFVTGATGYQGGAVARSLLSQKVPVHALVRNTQAKAAQDLASLGAKLFKGDFEDTEAIKAAIVGTTAVFLNVSPTSQGDSAEVKHAQNIIDAANAAGTVTTIVFSSVTMTGKHESFPGWGPQYPLAGYWVNKAAVEELVRSSDIKHYTILRPAFLMHNFHLPVSGFMFPELRERHALKAAYNPDTAMTVLDSADVGKFASAAILNPDKFHGREIDLGVEALTPAQIADHLTKASGKEVSFEFMPEKEALEAAEQRPMYHAQLWANEVGYKVDFDALEQYGIRLTTFAEYLAAHKEEVLLTYG